MRGLRSVRMVIKLTLALILLLAASTAATAQVSVPFTFQSQTVISSSQMNANFAMLASALNRTGGALTGNITATAGVTIDGIDISATLNQALLTTSSPTFVGLTLSGALSSTSTGQFSGVTITGTGASALDVGGGINAGTGNVALVTAAGKITAISSTYFDSLDGTNLTGVAKLASNNTFTNRNDFKLYSETKTAPTIGAGALTLDLSASTHFHVALNANITSLTISNPVPSGTIGSFVVKFTADGTVRTITWPASVVWAGGTAPTMTGTNTKRDFVTCIYDDGGTTYFCTITQNY